MSFRRWLALGGALLLCACGRSALDVGDPLTARIDPSVDPCSDFYRYACGSWLQTIELEPPERRRRLYDVIRAANEAVLLGIVERAQRNPNDVLGQFHRACMATGDRTAAQSVELPALRRAIDAIADRRDLMRVAARLHAIGAAALFEIEVFPSYGEPQRSVLWLWQPSGPESLREPEQRHSPSDPGALAELSPELAWDVYFAELSLRAPPLNLTPSHYFERLGDVVAGTPLEDSKRALHTALDGALADDVSIANTQGEERQRACVRSAERHLGGAIGQRFAHERRRTIAEARPILHAVERAFAERVRQASWLDAATRSSALEKLARLRRGWGAPAVFRSYRGLQLGSNHIDNVLSSRRLELAQALARVGRSADDEDWSATAARASSVNAKNQIILPAGYLAPPHFVGTTDLAASLGGLGTTLGHELAHLLDDRGRKFDATGLLRNWWSPDAARSFEQRAACLERSFARFGTVTRRQLGESIAELGGVQAAYRALEHDFEPERPAAGGLTIAQRFFVAYGQTQCAKYAPGERDRAAFSEHPAADVRINATLANVPAFQRAFACTPGSALHPPRSCEIW